MQQQRLLRLLLLLLLSLQVRSVHRRRQQLVLVVTRLLRAHVDQALANHRVDLVQRHHARVHELLHVCIFRDLLLRPVDQDHGDILGVTADCGKCLLDHEIKRIADGRRSGLERDTNAPYVVHYRVLRVIAVGDVFKNGLRGNELNVLVLSNQEAVDARR